MTIRIIILVSNCIGQSGKKVLRYILNRLFFAGMRKHLKEPTRNNIYSGDTDCRYCTRVALCYAPLWQYRKTFFAEGFLKIDSGSLS